MPAIEIPPEPIDPHYFLQPPDAGDGEFVNNDPSTAYGDSALDLTIIGEGRESIPADHTATAPPPVEHHFWARNTFRLERLGVRPLTEGTRITRGKILDEFERWRRNELVPSVAVPVAELPDLSEAEIATLQTFAPDYTAYREATILTASHRGPATVGLTDAQYALLHRVSTAFMAAVHFDIDVNTIGDPLSEMARPFMNAGIYTPHEHDTGWHVDFFNRPVVRYTAAWGDAGATNFGIGAIRQSDLLHAGAQFDGTVGPKWDHELVNHGTGVVSRFLANQGVHRSPALTGLRLFITASYPIYRPQDNRVGL